MAIYHMTVKTGSRQGGQSASAKCDYIERNGKYARVERDPVLHVEHGHMPSFAQDDPRSYWQAADQYERKNGVLFREVEFALPAELTLDQQRLLARQFAERLTAEQRMPYTLAIHAGGGTNPHCHLIISERVGDDIERTAAQHFARYNAKQPDQGGTKKADIGSRRAEWLAEARDGWSELANSALERAGHAERIDHRSLEAQGITDRVPGRHIGVGALAYEARTDEVSERRIDVTAEREDALQRLLAAKETGQRELIETRSELAQSLLDVRSLERERADLIARAVTARDALFERYRAGSEPEKNLQLAQAYGLGIKPETAAQAEQLQKQVASRMRSLDEIEAQRAALAAAPKPEPAPAPETKPEPEPVPKVYIPPEPVQRRGADLSALLAAGSRAAGPSEPLPSPTPSGASGGFPGARRARVPTGSAEADAYVLVQRNGAADQIAAMVEARANAEPVRWHEYESDGERYRRDAERAQDAKRVEWLHDGTGEWHSQPQAVIDQHAGRQPEPEQQAQREQSQDRGRER